MYWMNSTACSPKIIIPDLYNHHHHPIARCEKNRRRAVSYVSTGLACLPRDTNARTTTAEERLYMSPLDLPTNLYNRSSAVDSSFYNQPQVGKPTWGYNYPTVLRRLPPTSARCEKTAIIIRLRQWRDAKKTAEERFNMLARGWLAYPVTSIHSHLPPKSGCICHSGMRQRRITPRNPIRTTRQRRAHGASADTISMRFGDALLPPLGAAHPH